MLSLLYLDIKNILVVIVNFAPSLIIWGCEVVYSCIICTRFVVSKLCVCLCVCAVKSDAFGTREHRRAAVSGLCAQLYEEDVLLGWAVPRLGGGRSHIGQHYSGLMHLRDCNDFHCTGLGLQVERKHQAGCTLSSLELHSGLFVYASLLKCVFFPSRSTKGFIGKLYNPHFL